MFQVGWFTDIIDSPTARLACIRRMHFYLNGANIDAECMFIKLHVIRILVGLPKYLDSFQIVRGGWPDDDTTILEHVLGRQIVHGGTWTLSVRNLMLSIRGGSGGFCSIVDRIRDISPLSFSALSHPFLPFTTDIRLQSLVEISFACSHA